MSGKKREFATDAIGQELRPGDVVVTTQSGYDGTKSELHKACVAKINPLTTSVIYDTKTRYYWNSIVVKPDNAIVKIAEEREFAVIDRDKRDIIQLPMSEALVALKQLEAAEPNKGYRIHYRIKGEQDYS